MDTFVIETERLTRRFGEQISVNKVNLQVPQGGVYGFLGPNGAGKTTTIRMLLGLIKPTEGLVRIFGEELSNHRKAILQKIGALVESPSYYGHLTGYENCKVITQMLGLQINRIEEVLNLVRLKKDAHRKVKGYSLGMKQRLGIAMALISNPKLIILDEPTNGLDPAGIQEIRELIISLPQKTGVTILVSSHLLSEIEQIATHVGIIAKGTLIYQDTLVSLQQRSNSHLEIEVNRPMDACRILTKFGQKVYIENQSLCLDTLDRDQTASCIEALVLNKIDVYRVVEKNQSLEEIFIEMTGKEGSL